MGALPKKKYAKARQGKRRSHHGLVTPQPDDCPQCHSPRLSHHACPTCGNYDGREAIEIKSPKKTTG